MNEYSKSKSDGNVFKNRFIGMDIHKNYLQIAIIDNNALFNTSTLPENLFINIFIDSDDDETTGFLGYGYRYLLTHNASNSLNGNKFSSTQRSFQGSTPNYLIHTEILEGEELEVITRTVNLGI